MTGFLLFKVVHPQRKSSKYDRCTYEMATFDEVCCEEQIEVGDSW